MTDPHPDPSASASPAEDEPETPFWLPALGFALFVFGGIGWAVSPSLASASPPAYVPPPVTVVTAAPPATAAPTPPPQPVPEAPPPAPPPSAGTAKGLRKTPPVMPGMGGRPIMKKHP